MAITFVDDAIATTASGTGVTVTIPAGAQTDDLMLLFVWKHDDQATWTGPTDWTVVDEFNSTLGNDHGVALYYKVHDGSEANPTVNWSETEEGGAILSVYRGIDTTTPIDVTYVRATHLTDYVNDSTPLNDAITTITDNAFVILMQGGTQNIYTTAAAPTNYTLRESEFANTLNVNIFTADREITSAGTETPGVWTHSPDESTVDGSTITLALRPKLGITIEPGKADLSFSNKLPAAVLNDVRVTGKADLSLSNKLPVVVLNHTIATGKALLSLSGKTAGAASRVKTTKMGFIGSYLPNNGFKFPSANNNHAMAFTTNGAVDNKLFTLSFWTKLDSSAAGGRFMGAAGPGHPSSQFRCSFETTSSLAFFLRNDLGQKVVEIANHDVGFTNDNTEWHHVIITLDLADTDNRFIFVDDVEQSVAWDTYQGFLSIPWPSLERVSLGNNAGTSGANPLTGAMQEWWMANQFIDLSVVANRRDFIDADGCPVDLGANGTGPTGTAPLYLYRGDFTSFYEDQSGNGNDLILQNSGQTDEGTIPRRCSTFKLEGKIPAVSIEALPIIVTPGKADLVLTGKTPAAIVEGSTVRIPGKATLTLTNKLPVQTLAITASIGKATLTLDNKLPAAVLNDVRVTGKATLTLDNKLPAAVLNDVRVTGKATLTLTNKLPVQTLSITASVGKAALTLNNKLPAAVLNDVRVAGIASLVLTGKQPSLVEPFTITAGMADFIFSNKLPVLTVSTLPRITGKATLTLTNKLPIVDSPSITVEPGVASLTIANKSPVISIHKSPGKASFTLTTKLPNITKPFLTSVARFTLVNKQPDADSTIRGETNRATLVMTGKAPVIAVSVLPIITGKATLVMKGDTPVFRRWISQPEDPETWTRV